MLSVLLLTILTGLAAGGLMTFLELRLIFSAPLEIALRRVIVNTLILLAIIDVFKTPLAYFTEGRVKVTFIVDTILVVMLTEVILQWVQEASLEEWLTLGGILAIIRVIAVQWSPTTSEPALESGQRQNQLPLSGT